MDCFQLTLLPRPLSDISELKVHFFPLTPQHWYPPTTTTHALKRAGLQHWLSCCFTSDICTTVRNSTSVARPSLLMQIAHEWEVIWLLFYFPSNNFSTPRIEATDITYAAHKTWFVCTLIYTHTAFDSVNFKQPRYYEDVSALEITRATWLLS